MKFDFTQRSEFKACEVAANAISCCALLGDFDCEPQTISTPNFMNIGSHLLCIV